jgi:secondary thiamine-phosphate synthase enzyme
MACSSGSRRGQRNIVTICGGADDNGSSHVRAALLGPSLTVPFVDGALTLGTWQQIMLLEFDTRPRTREVVVQIIGE